MRRLQVTPTLQITVAEEGVVMAPARQNSPIPLLQAVAHSTITAVRFTPQTGASLVSAITQLPRTLLSTIMAAQSMTHVVAARVSAVTQLLRSEEHTSELQSPMYLVCRLLLEKKKQK